MKMEINEKDKFKQMEEFDFESIKGALNNIAIILYKIMGTWKRDFKQIISIYIIY
jgi:hypothetical protein